MRAVGLMRCTTRLVHAWFWVLTQVLCHLRTLRQDARPCQSAAAATACTAHSVGPLSAHTGRARAGARASGAA